MMVCKRCESSGRQKSGFIEDNNGIDAKDMGIFTPYPTHDPLQENLFALSLHASGLSLYRIAKYFRVSSPEVLRWIKKLGHTLFSKVAAKGGVVVMGLDEMWHSLKNPTNCRFGKLMILLETDSWTGNV